MHKFDVLFLDFATPRYYDGITYEKEALGGTEAAVLNVADGLAAQGLKVGIVLNFEFEPTLSQKAFILPASMLPQLDCSFVVSLRSAANFHLFPKARKFVWLHDVATDKIQEWQKHLIEHNPMIVTVSQWHKLNVQKHLPDYKNITFIFPITPKQCYLAKDARPEYDPFKLVWPASPHKGLDHALKQFEVLQKENPRWKLIVFNPGYFASKMLLQPGVVDYGPQPRTAIWSQIATSLAVFYPVQFDETFGCIASESNALGTPLATFKRAALAESVSSENQFAVDDTDLLNKVREWNKNGRPETMGTLDFLPQNIIARWVALFGSFL